MTTAYTSLLGLALPVTGELSGTWGDTVNNSITSLLDSAIAGTTTLSSDADVTLTTTTGAANTSREAILLWTAGGTVTRTITAPAQSKIYTVINASSSTQSIKLVGAGPTTGVTIIKGESALVAWNGSDFIKISNISGAGVFSSITNTGLTSGRVVYSTTGGLETDSTNLTFDGTILTAAGLAGPHNGTVGATTANTGAFTTLTTSSTVTLSGGTANGVAYLNGSKVLTTGSALTFDGTNFSTTGTATATKLIPTGTSVTGNGMYLPATNSVGISTAGVNAVYIDASQNVGIGTSSPTSILNVKAASPIFRLETASTVSSGGVAYNAIRDSTGSDVFVSGFLGLANCYQFSTTAAAGFMRFLTGSQVEAMRIDSSGNVGIGMTPSGDSLLEIYGPSSATIYKNVNTGTGSSDGFYVGMAKSSGTDGYVYNRESGNLIFGTVNAERMRIDTSGNLLVGTTSTLNSNSKLSVYNTSGGVGGIAVGYSSTSGQYRIQYLFGSNGHYYFDSGTNAAYLSSAGAWTNASDARLKNSIVDIQHGLSAVMNTKPRSYKMNNLEGNYIGFVAQELQTVIPEVVSGDPEKQLGVDYGSLVAVAFKAIQEQQALIQSLTTRLTALEQK